jgi:hypothetical protein
VSASGHFSTQVFSRSASQAFCVLAKRGFPHANRLNDREADPIFSVLCRVAPTFWAVNALLIDSPRERPALTFVQFADDPPATDVQLPTTGLLDNSATRSAYCYLLGRHH